jgi:hypothetical protein
MSDLDAMTRRFRRIATAIIVSALLPSVVVGQSVDDARRQLDSLLPELRDAKAAFEAIRPTKAIAVGGVSVNRGHLHLRVDSSIVALAERAAVQATASLDRTFGEHAPLAAMYTFTVMLDSVGPARARKATLRILRTQTEELSPRGAARRAGDSERVVTMESEEETVALLAGALDAVAAAPLHASLDDKLRLWFRFPLPAMPESREQLENLYVDLTTASTELSRRCLAGDLRRCRQVLGLDAVDDPIVDAYTAVDRRRFVAAAPERLRVAARAAEYDRCVVDGDDAACIARLRDLPSESLTSAYSTTALRRSFARWVIQLGDAGAYGRLRTAVDSPLPDRFGVAAGMPLDSAVASWRAHVIAGRPMQPAIPPLNAVATILWVGACGALALRSSRWR